MKKYLIATALLLFINGCGVKIKSVVDNSASVTPYTNPLVVIPFENGVTRNFADLLKQKIESKFKSENRRVEILLVEQTRNELKLNSSTDIEARINSSISSDNKDLILVFRPTKLQFYNNGLQSATYLITGTDIKTKREIWKAEFTSSSSFGPALFADKAATSIYEKLKADRVI